jgi:hypothetical protein
MFTAALLAIAINEINLSIHKLMPR